MSDLLTVGASGVRAYQTALTTTSENIANAGNIDYSRRSVDLNEVATAGAGLTYRGAANGMGVVVGATVRAADGFRSAAVRSAGADLARTEAGSVWLDRIQSSLTGNDLSGRITSFFNAAKALAADPTSTAARAVMLESAATVAAGFSATGDALTQTTADLDATADQATAKLGELGSALAKINDGLGRTSPGTATAATLADQRDQILEQMSALVDVNATFDPSGRATVRVGGSGGPVLVAGTEAGGITYTRNAAGTVAFTVHRAGTTSALTPNGGALAGIVDGAQRVQDARAALDGVATRFTDGVNALQAAGRDLTGAAGAPLFAVGSDPTKITLALDDPAGIAAASVGEGTRGNGNLAALESFRSGAGFETSLTSLVANNAAAIDGRATVAAAQSAIHDGAIAARDAISGVDLDNEAVDLLRFQQAYQASSRIIQVARETFQSILEIH